MTTDMPHKLNALYTLSIKFTYLRYRRKIWQVSWRCISHTLNYHFSPNMATHAVVGRDAAETAALEFVRVVTRVETWNVEAVARESCF